MAYLTGFGPTTFSIAVGGVTLTLCIKLTAKTTPVDGTYDMSVCERPTAPNPGCSTAPLLDVGSVTLDQSGKITAYSFPKGFANKKWTSFGGTFHADGTGSGNIEDDQHSPILTAGTWSAGGSGKEFPKGAHA